MTKKLVPGIVLGTLFLASTGGAFAGPEEDYYKAYYLHHAKGDLQAAVKLYEKVADSSRLDSAVSADAALQARCCTEDLASANFAALMPPEALAYVELRSPGEHVARLLDQLGLVGDGDWMLPGKVKDDIRRFAVSPSLVRALSNVKGLGVAVTGFDPVKQMPQFVAVLHPGNNDVLRGLLETALPAACEAIPPIRGTRAFKFSQEGVSMYVALTPRLVVVSPMRTEVDSALKRLTQANAPALADNKDFRSLQGEDQSRMIFACFNAVQAMPLIQNLVQMGSNASQEFAMANALLDLESLRWVAFRAGVGDDGLSKSLVVRFEEDQNNLVYNFLRTPPLTGESLKCVPAGAAGFMAMSLSEPAPDAGRGKTDRAEAVRRITGLDLGREIFANIEENVLFLLPPGEQSAEPGPAGFVMPDVGLVLTVKDSLRSAALWTQLLSLPTFATGQPAPEGKALKIAETEATVYEWPEGIKAYFANVDNHIIITMTGPAMEQCVRAARGGNSILDDEAFKPGMARIGEDSSKVMFVHPGRCIRVARAVSGEELEEVKPFEHLLEKLVACVITHESNGEFRVTSALTGIPDVSGVLEQIASRAMSGRHRGESSRVFVDKECPADRSTNPACGKAAHSSKPQKKERVPVGEKPAARVSPAAPTRIKTELGSVQTIEKPLRRAWPMDRATPHLSFGSGTIVTAAAIRPGRI